MNVCFLCIFSFSLLVFLSLFNFLQLPETPQWLLSRNRDCEAEKSLRWLRGWVLSDAITHEFDDLKRHSDLFKSCTACIKQNLKCTHSSPSLSEKFAKLKRKQLIKPLFIVISMFTLIIFASLSSMGPFFIQILKTYQSPIAPDKIITLMSILDALGCFTMMILVRYIYWETANLSTWSIEFSFLLRYNHVVWIHIFVTRTNFLRSKKSSSIPIGKQSCWFYSSRLSDDT